VWHIVPSGERLSLIASVIIHDGRAAGRTGLGAVTGAKKFKAIAVGGNKKVDVANPERFRRLRSLSLHEVRRDLASIFSIIGIEFSSHFGSSRKT